MYLGRCEASHPPGLLEALHALPEHVAALADEQFERLKFEPRHPSLHFKRIVRLWSGCVDPHYRALELDKPEGVVWFWIGSHADYDQLIGQQ